MTDNGVRIAIIEGMEGHVMKQAVRNDNETFKGGDGLADGTHQLSVKPMQDRLRIGG